MALAPVHEPEAVHAVAFVLLHVMVELAPLAMEAGLAPIVMVGAGGFTVTVADWGVLVPPAPVQARV
jgi:hypothetical protein